MLFRSDLYGQHTTARLAATVACFYATPDLPLQIVAVEPLTPGGQPHAKLRAVFYSTTLHVRPVEILQVYAQRWSLEVTFHGAKGALGVEEPQGTGRRTVERHAPVLLLLYSLVVEWFARHGHARWRPPRWPWYRAKATPSFADLLTCLRQATLRRHFRRVFQNPAVPRVLRKPLQSLLTLWKRAA